MIFLIDNTMGANLITAVRGFIKRFVDSVPIGPDEVQVGAVQFSNVPQLAMDLNTYRTKDEIVSGLALITQKQGQTVNAGAALDFVRLNMLRAEKGSRIQQGIPQIIMLMTGRRSSDSVVKPVRELQKMGVLTLAGGFKAADEGELKQISFAESTAYMLKDIRGLRMRSNEMINTLSTLAGTMVTEVPTETGNTL